MRKDFWKFCPFLVNFVLIRMTLTLKLSTWGIWESDQKDVILYKYWYRWQKCVHGHCCRNLKHHRTFRVPYWWEIIWRFAAPQKDPCYMESLILPLLLPLLPPLLLPLVLLLTIPPPTTTTTTTPTTTPNYSSFYYYIYYYPYYYSLLLFLLLLTAIELSLGGSSPYNRTEKINKYIYIYIYIHETIQKSVKTKTQTHNNWHK
jgi:hypothetical protein